MLTRLLAWLFGRRQPPPPARVDPLALSVTRRQHKVARRLEKVTNRPADELLDYQLADRILGGRR